MAYQEKRLAVRLTKRQGYKMLQKDSGLDEKGRLKRRRHKKRKKLVVEGKTRHRKRCRKLNSMDKTEQKAIKIKIFSELWKYNKEERKPRKRVSIEQNWIQKQKPKQRYRKNKVDLISLNCKMLNYK